MSNVRYGMVIDTKRCVGCWTCSVACSMSNNVPNDIWWNRVLTIGGEGMDTPSGKWPNVKMGYATLACQHCEDPACIKACPVGATYKREDGLVVQDSEKCIGCRYCMAACPYTGVRNFNWNEPEYVLDFPVGEATAPAHQKHTVEKCTFCAQRVDEGKNPACVDGCPAIARFFGDLNDPESIVSQKLLNREHFQLLPEKGTNPSVYYLT